MGRIKGWVYPVEVTQTHHKTEEIYVEEIPKNAIRGEAVVEYDAWSETLKREVRPILRLPDFPAHLIDKKVSFVIIPEED